MTSASLFDTFDSSAAFGTGDTLSQSLWENIYDEEDGGGDGERGSNVRNGITFHLHHDTHAPRISGVF